MDKTKTAMQQLLYDIQFFKLHTVDEVESAIVNKLLELERKQIIDACIEFGNLNGVDTEDYENYFTNTYNQ